MKPHIIILTLCLLLGFIAGCNQPFTFKIEDNVPHELLEGRHMLISADHGFMQHLDVQTGELFDVPFPGLASEVTVDKTHDRVYCMDRAGTVSWAEVGVWEWEMLDTKIEEGWSIEIGGNGQYLYYTTGGLVGDARRIERLELSSGDIQVMSVEVGEELFSEFDINPLDGSVVARSNPSPFTDTAYVYVFSASGELTQQIQLDSMYTGYGSRSESPKWLPDGKRILQRNRFHNGAFLLDLEANGKAEVRNEGFPFYGDYTFSPSGENLLVGNSGSISVFPFSAESSLAEAIFITGTYQDFASSFVQRVYWW